ncbi:uncharacterized protein [Drosophila takahashii]|uniref:uncharacterized protein n=1 Tax=Drosophila takahashii TaxID=29030 RepID=UPI003898ED50
MATNQDPEEQAPPESRQIDRCVFNMGSCENKREPKDSDFSMSSARLAFLRPQSLDNSHQNPSPASDKVETPLKDQDQDPHPWMKCCGRNFTRSIFSLQPSPNPRPGFTRRRRGSVHGHSQNTP